MKLNCKPQQLAWVKRPSACEPCSAKLLGLPTKVSHVITPLTMGAAIRELLEGPVWMLAEPFRCPLGAADCSGVDRLPDACLQPFDPASEPGAEVQDVPVAASLVAKC